MKWADNSMSKFDKLLNRILRGTSDNNIQFNDLCSIMRSLNFNERVKGSHHISTRSGIPDIVNLQPKGNKAKGYQVKQVRNLIVKYKLGDSNDSL